MKKKQIRFLLPIIIIFIELLAFLLYIRDSQIIDYTKVKNEELFMVRLRDHIDGYQLKDAEENSFCLFEVIDENNKPIANSIIQLYRDEDVITSLKTNGDGIATISGLERKKYAFKQIESKNNVTLNEKLTKVDLSKEQCYFVIKNGKEETSITKMEDSKVVNLLSTEEIKLLKTTKSIDKDSYIFLIESLRGSQLNLYSENDEENKKINYYLLIDDATIKKINIRWKEKTSGQKLVDENNKETMHFNQSAFSLVYEKVMKETPVEMTIIFEKNAKTYAIKKDFILGKEFKERGSVVIKNNTNSEISFDLRLDSTDDNSEESSLKKSKIAAGEDYYIDELKSGIYYLAINHGKDSSFKYFVVEGERLTKVNITE